MFKQKHILFLFWAVSSLFIYNKICHWYDLRETDIWSFIALLLLIFNVASVIIYVLRKVKLFSASLCFNITILCFAFAITLFGAEILLRTFAKNLKSYGERNGANKYNSSYLTYLHPCDSCKGGFYYINDPNAEVDFDFPEFHHRHKYNSLGLRDKEFSTHKATNEFRIFGIGDSFTEGVGVSADSTWLKQLEYLLNKNSSDLLYTTYNCGAHGSDLIREYDLLNDCLLKFKPDLVILNLNSTDINDILSRGADSKPNSDGKLLNPNGPWHEFLFGSSYLVRLFMLNVMQYNWMIYPQAELPQVEAEIMNSISKKLIDFQTLAEKENFNFLLTLHPLDGELTDSTAILPRLKINTSIRKIDLAPVLQNIINGNKEICKFYYYPIDGHFTTLGYGLLAETIYKEYFVAEKH